MCRVIRRGPFELPGHLIPIHYLKGFRLEHLGAYDT